MRVTKPNSLCVCGECNATDALKVRWQNPDIVQNSTFGICLHCASNLASQLLQHVRKAQLSQPSPKKGRQTSTGE